MSDLCKQCSIDTYGQDFRELAGVTTEDDVRNGVFKWALCEGCGSVQVTPDGKCMGYCFLNHERIKMSEYTLTAELEKVKAENAHLHYLLVRERSRLNVALDYIRRNDEKWGDIHVNMFLRVPTVEGIIEEIDKYLAERGES